VPISPTQPLTPVQIARYWSLELRGTPEEESADDILYVLLSALIFRQIRPDSDYDGVLSDVWSWSDAVTDDTWKKALRGETGLKAPRGALRAFAHLREIRIRRADFVLWAVEREYDRPKFWDRARTDEYVMMGWKTGFAVGRYEAQKASGSTEEPPSFREDKNDLFARPPSDPLSVRHGPADMSKREAWILEEGRFFNDLWTMGWRKGYAAGRSQQEPTSTPISAATPEGQNPTPRERLKPAAAKRDDVKKQLQAKIDAGKMTFDDLGRNKESLGAEFGVSPSTAYNAALELRKELEQKKK
jgi:hypothetical protein